MFRQRQLDDVAVDVDIVVQKVNGFQKLFLFDVGGEMVDGGGETYSLAVLLDTVHVGLGGSVVAYDYCISDYGSAVCGLVLRSASDVETAEKRLPYLRHCSNTDAYSHRGFCDQCDRRLYERTDRTYSFMDRIVLHLL